MPLNFQMSQINQAKNIVVSLYSNSEIFFNRNIQQYSIKYYKLMGCTASTEITDPLTCWSRNIGSEGQQYWSIGSLNYSGLNGSPYQFYEKVYEEGTQENKINQIFRQLCKQRFPQFDAKDGKNESKNEKTIFKWKFKDIDRQYRTNRLSPLYNPLAGINENNYLMSKSQFKEEWSYLYEKQWKQRKNEFIKKIGKQDQLKKIKAELTMLQERNGNENQGHGINFEERAQNQQGCKKQQNLKLNQQTRFTSDKKQCIEPTKTQKSKKQLQQSKENCRQIKKNNDSMKSEAQKCAEGVQSNQNQYDIVVSAVIDQLRQFDYLVYKCILIYLYGKQIIKGLEQTKSIEFNIKGKQYQKFQQKKFSKSYLDQKIKFGKLSEMLDQSQLDILFVQNIPETFVYEFNKWTPNYRIIFDFNNVHNAILIHRSKFKNQIDFGKENMKLFEKEKQRIEKNYKMMYKGISKSQVQRMVDLQLQEITEILNINGKTIIQKIGSLILMNTSLTSNLKSKKGKPINQVYKQPEPQSHYQPSPLINKFKQLKNKQFASPNHQQMEHLMICLEYLKESFPDSHILVGAILNCENAYQFKQTQSFSFYPDSKNTIKTCIQKRTLMQAQANKGNDLQQKRKDYLISSVQPINNFVTTVNGERIMEINVHQSKQQGVDIYSKKRKTPLMPNHNHPYGSYLIVGQFRFNIEQSMDIENDYSDDETLNEH